MAYWAWPHTPVNNWARLLLRGGPFDGEQVGFLPSDVSAPAEVAWSGWFPDGFRCYRYTHGQADVLLDLGRVNALIYRFTGQRVELADIPPVVAAEAEVYADAADLLYELRAFPLGKAWNGWLT